MINRVRITYKLQGGFSRSFPKPFTYMTMRDRFDNLLAERATSAGATLRDGFKVDRIEVDDDEARVFGQKDLIAGAILVGADGANSVVAHQLGLLQGAEIGVGLESEVYPEPQRLEPWSSTAGLDFGTIRGRYMWLFPKADHLSIGVAGFARFGASMRQLLGKYLEHLQLGDSVQRLTRGHRLPRRRRGMPIQQGRAILIGDAAGRIDFWSGEGIYYARRSAQAAALPISDRLEGNVPDLREYENSADRELMPELLIARTMARIGVWLPWPAYRLMKSSDRAWNVSCQVLRAEKSYHDLRGKMGRFTFLFDMAGVGT